VQSDGGLCFWQLHPDKESEGRKIVEELVAQMTNHRRQLTVILAGYKQDMEELLASNQGLRSRFSHYMDFEDYKQGKCSFRDGKLTIKGFQDHREGGASGRTLNETPHQESRDTRLQASPSTRWVTD
jgi:hypothetical protein